ncbi:MAG: hypothetical protein R6U28_05995 [Cyclonatronaceae bacterium]
MGERGGKGWNVEWGEGVEWVEGWIGGWMDRWMDGSVGGRMDR